MSLHQESNSGSWGRQWEKGRSEQGICGSRDREAQARTFRRKMSSCSGNSGTGRPAEERCGLAGAIPCRRPALAFTALTVRGSWGCPGAVPAQHPHPPHHYHLPQPEQGTKLTSTDSPLVESLRARGNFPQLFLWHVRPDLPRTASSQALPSNFNKGLSAATAVSRKVRSCWLWDRCHRCH